MLHLKARILALTLILASVGMIYYNWHQLLQDGKYYMKVAAFAPVIGVGGVFLLIFPGMSGKPKSTREKIIVLAVTGIGLAAGLINLYLMDPGFFGVSK
jgi:Na+-driven multidrug efflux pump